MTDQEEPQLTAKEETDFFVKAEAEMKKVNAINAELSKAEKLLSKAVQNIHDNLGSGPFRWKDRDLKITKRKDVYSMKSLEPKKAKAIGA